MQVKGVRFHLAVALSALLAACSASISPEDSRWLGFPGGDGPGAGKKVVFVAGDEEYRSEEALPMLARLMSEHHGFECVVLFSQDPETGEIDPDNSSNIPGLHLIEDADLLVLQLRFRELPDADMAHLMKHVEKGKPLVGIRTTTHAFNYNENLDSPFAKWSWRSQEPKGGFGQEILGETWVAHHGHHGQEATRGVPREANANHPTLRGVEDVFGPTDVYAIRDLPKDAIVLLDGAVLGGMSPDSPILDDPKNNPMHPVAWLRLRPLPGGGAQRIFATTMGAATDWSSEDLRRLFLNASLWALGKEAEIPEGGLRATMIGSWNPTPFGFGNFQRGLRPRDASEH